MSIEKRRKVRALETARDKLIEQKEKTAVALKKTRTELASARKKK